MKLVNIRSYWNRVDPLSNMISDLIKRKFGHRQREHHVKIKAKIRMMLLQAKENPTLPADLKNLGEGHGKSSPSQPRRNQSC